MSKIKHTFKDIPIIVNDGPAMFAPILVSNKYCYNDTYFSYYEVDVYIESNLDYLTIKAYFKSEAGVIIESNELTKTNLIEGNTYRYKFEVVHDDDIATCNLEDNLLYFPEQTMTSACTGDCVITSNNDNLTSANNSIILGLIGIFVGVIILLGLHKYKSRNQKE
ncbi:MAG: hypothetical protein KQ78_00817 [Candidatus Izimaplasma bacterium HR2]|nr:MAG: hypothetical protein KQ78_00817 [Candidatus Izimaplasma bacterium HR2]